VAPSDTRTLGEIKTHYTIAISGMVPAMRVELLQLAAQGTTASAITTTGTGRVTATESPFKTLRATLDKVVRPFVVDGAAATIKLSDVMTSATSVSRGGAPGRASLGNPTTFRRF
jgi:hypothetical protein